MKLTYKSAGVDIDKARLFVEAVKRFTRSTKRTGATGKIGGFGGTFELRLTKYKNPVLVSSTDGVGTKLKVAFLVDKHDTVGIDLVAMNVNDVVTYGAEPLFFLDYISTGKIDKKILIDVVKGIAEGCKQAGCTLVGGETAEMPGFYKEGEYELAGFCVGVTEKSEIIDGSRIKVGDIALGLGSNGLHSNGYSLVRRVFPQAKLKSLSNELLRPTRIYVNPILALKKKVKIKGIAHITGGAFLEKVPRIIPRDKSIVIVKGSWPVPYIFKLIQTEGKIVEQEMYRTFNMGLGMIVVISPKDVKAARDLLAHFGIKSWIVGSILKGKGEVKVI
ncbi:MAG: phosphoribosylaminoimidazole synthetase [Omnitrophica WOR_2 bacterium SM23_29]|nr:MAG: phosphoribosylaminoimidazole synthetase [Omnitrophica WOR_2 bacterium SM23_29]